MDKKCEYCNGKGWIITNIFKDNSDAVGICKYCKGTGLSNKNVIKESRSFNINIKIKK